MATLIISFLSVFCLFLFPFTGLSQVNISELTISADELIREDDTILLKGNVKAIFDASYLSCEEATIFSQGRKDGGSWKCALAGCGNPCGSR